MQLGPDVAEKSLGLLDKKVQTPTARHNVLPLPVLVMKAAELDLGGEVLHSLDCRDQSPVLAVTPGFESPLLEELHDPVQSSVPRSMS